MLTRVYRSSYARRNGVFFAINLLLVKIQCGDKLKL